MLSTHNRHSRAGFTLLELLVVVSILVVAMLVFAVSFGGRSAGPALERHAATISGMVANVRQNAAVRKVHGEIVFDYRNDRVVALSRRRLASYAMEDEVGSGDAMGRRAGGAVFAESRTLGLRDGKALELPTSGASFTIPWAPQFDVSGDYEGIALAFDFCPLEMLDADGVIQNRTGSLASMGAVFQLSVSAVRDNSVRLQLSSGGVIADSGAWLATYRWHRVEVAVSRYSVSLWIDGRLDEGEIRSPDFTVPPALGQDLRLGGVPCRVDNLELFSLVSSQSLQLEGAQLIAWDVDPKREVYGEAESIYHTPGKPAGPITGPGATAPAGPVPGLPADPVTAIRHVYFDASGKLDPARHPGAVEIYMVSLVGGEIRRMALTFHPMGVMTSDYLDLLPWEPPPQQEAQG